MKIYRW